MLEYNLWVRQPLSVSQSVSQSLANSLTHCRNMYLDRWHCDRSQNVYTELSLDTTNMTSALRNILSIEGHRWQVPSSVCRQDCAARRRMACWLHLRRFRFRNHLPPSIVYRNRNLRYLLALSLHRSMSTLLSRGTIPDRVLEYILGGRNFVAFFARRWILCVLWLRIVRIGTGMNKFTTLKYEFSVFITSNQDSSNSWNVTCEIWGFHGGQVTIRGFLGRCPILHGATTHVTCLHVCPLLLVSGESNNSGRIRI